MPLTEREQGFNEAIDVVSKLFGERSEVYYKVCGALIEGTTEQKLVSGRAFEYRAWAGRVYDLRKLSPEEIAERLAAQHDDPQ